MEEAPASNSPGTRTRKDGPASLPPDPEDTAYALSAETKLRMFRDSPALSKQCPEMRKQNDKDSNPI